MVVLSNCICQNCVIRGKVSDVRDGVIYFTNTTNRKVDSSKIANGSFVYKTNIDTSYVSAIYLKSGKDFLGPYNLILCNQNISVRIDSTSIVSLTDRDSINRIYLLFRKNHFDFINSIERLSSPDVAEMAKNYEQRKIVFTSYIKSLYKNVNTYKNNVAAVVAIDNFIIKDNLLSADSVLVLFETLNPLVRNSFFGIQVGWKISIMRSLTSGKKAPPFELTDLANNIVKLESYKGKFVLINFWASWCGPCRIENLELVKAFSDYRNPHFVIFNISFDDNMSKMEVAVKKDKLERFQNFIIVEGFNSKMAKDYNIHGLPASYLIDKNGLIIGSHLSPDIIKKKIE